MRRTCNNTLILINLTSWMFILRSGGTLKVTIGEHIRSEDNPNKQDIEVSVSHICSNGWSALNQIRMNRIIALTENNFKASKTFISFSINPGGLKQRNSIKTGDFLPVPRFSVYQELPVPFTREHRIPHKSFVLFNQMLCLNNYFYFFINNSF